MPRKLLLEEFQVIAAKKGGRCLSTEYVRKDAKLDWECREGHIWPATAGSIKQGSWCPFCAGNRRGTIEDLRAVAAKKEGECLSVEYLGDDKNHLWRCREGHEWPALPTNVKKGSWCPDCAGNRRGSIEILQKVAEDHKGRCLSNEYLGALAKHQWECSEGHRWWGAANNVVFGTWCPTCAKNIPMTLEDAKAVAISNGGVCLSKTYTDRNEHLRWRCSEGHEWPTSMASVQMGHWCPKCSGVGRITIEELQELARSRGGECLSGQVESGERHVRWQCSDGHEWMSVPNSIKSGSWCPECAAGKSERACRAILGKLLGVPFSKSPLGRLPWLKNTRGKAMELDGYYAQLELAFEYHGRQHYEFLPHFHRNESALLRRVEDDQTKMALCEQNGVRLIVVPYWIELEGVEVFLREKLDELGIYCAPGPPISLESLSEAIYSRNRIENLRRLAEARGGVLLTDSYLGPTRSHRFRCAQGHEWSTTPATLNTGAWCKRCSMTRAWSRRSAEKVRLAPGDQPRLLDEEPPTGP